MWSLQFTERYFDVIDMHKCCIPWCFQLMKSFIYDIKKTVNFLFHRASALKGNAILYWLDSYWSWHLETHNMFPRVNHFCCFEVIFRLNIYKIFGIKTHSQNISNFQFYWTLWIKAIYQCVFHSLITVIHNHKSTKFIKSQGFIQISCIYSIFVAFYILYYDFLRCFFSTSYTSPK